MTAAAAVHAAETDPVETVGSKNRGKESTAEKIMQDVEEPEAATSKGPEAYVQAPA